MAGGSHAWRRIGVAAVLLANASVLQAQVYKCSGKDGVSYQSQPCSEGPALKQWTNGTAPDAAAMRANTLRLQAIQREMDARNRPRPHTAGRQAKGAQRPAAQPPGQWVHVSTAVDASRCATVKAQREAAFRAAGHRRTFALSRAWDDRVYDACR